MAEIFVLPDPINICAGNNNLNAYEVELNLISPGNSPWVLIPEDVASISVTISFSDGGRGKIQTTTDIIRRVKEDNGTIPVDWALGVVNDTIQDAVVPVTAIRVVQTSSTGTTKLTMRAQ